MGCSEDSIIVIFKHVQHVGIITTFCVPGEIFLKFCSTWGTEKMAGLWCARRGRISTQGDTMRCFPVKVVKFLRTPILYNTSGGWRIKEGRVIDSTYIKYVCCTHSTKLKFHFFFAPIYLYFVGISRKNILGASPLISGQGFTLDLLRESQHPPDPL